MNIIRLLHVSDLHLSYNKRFFRFSHIHIPCLEEVTRIAYKNASINQLDCILISGDLADSGTSDDLGFAKNTLFPHGYQVQPQWIGSHGGPSFNVKDKPIIFVPGNHDRYHEICDAPGSKSFDKFFDGYWNGGNDGVDSWGVPDNDNPKLIIVCADFSLKNWHDAPAPGLWHGLGKVYDDRLRKLIEVTREAKKKGPVIWSIHFAPNTQSIIDKRIKTFLRLIGSRELVGEAQVYDIKYILCGHIHEPSRYYVGTSNQVCIYSGGTATCIGLNDKPTINLVEISIQTNQIHSVRVYPFEWDEQKFTFVKKNNRL